MESEISLLFNRWITSGESIIIQLFDRNMVPVGALYPKKVNIDDFIVSQTNNSEKYYLYLGGLAVFFTYYQISTN